MTTDAQKDRLLEEFQHYLEHADLAQITAGEQPDLATLFGELAGLKGEVKAEARQFKNTLDTLSDALAIVQRDNQALAAELATYTERLQHHRHEVLRSILLDSVDLYDRLGAGLDVLQHYRPVSSLFKHSKQQDVRFISSFRQGQELTLKRFEQLLQRHRVYPIACVGKMLDPRTMNTVEIGCNTQFDNGIVLEELRKGFLFEDQVLRLAEVKVNKL